MLNIYKTRKKKLNTRDLWTLDKIKEGIEKYKTIYSKYPSTLDFDKVDFLPSSRLIQRNFGGIVELKRKLKIDDVHNFTTGEYRSKVASTTYKNAINQEEIFYRYLIDLFPEINVHEHKILRPGHICCDFFVYTTESSGFAIDIFYADDLFSLSRIITIKTKRYTELRNESMVIYFVLVGNPKIKQEQINIMTNNKKNKIPKNIHVCSEEFFKGNTLKNFN